MRVGGQSVCLLPEKVAIHDIADAEGFVAATIERSGVKPSPAEYEELLAEGLAILYDLAAKFEPHREGYESPGRFSGFAAQFLPRKLGDAWHRLHPEHRYVTDPETGKRRWIFYPSPDSLDHILAGGDGSAVHAEHRIRPSEQWSPPDPLPDAA